MCRVTAAAVIGFIKDDGCIALVIALKEYVMFNLQFPIKILKRHAYNNLNEENVVLTALLKAYTVNYESASKDPAECIIFSMDRALQLHAFLGSYYDNVRPPLPLRIVYRTSTDDHYRAYMPITFGFGFPARRSFSRMYCFSSSLTDRQSR